MKKFLLSLLTLVACTITASAADIVFDMSDPNAYVDDAGKVTYATIAEGSTQGVGVSYTSGVVFQNGVIKITVEYSSGNGIMAFTQSGGDIAADALGVMAYPSPARDVLNVAAADAIEQVEVYSLSGSKVLSAKVTPAQEVKISVETLTPGIYLMQVQTTHSRHTLRIVKE